MFSKANQSWSRHFDIYEFILPTQSLLNYLDHTATHTKQVMGEWVNVRDKSTSSQKIWVFGFVKYYLQLVSDNQINSSFAFLLCCNEKQLNSENVR